MSPPPEGRPLAQCREVARSPSAQAARPLRVHPHSHRSRPLLLHHRPEPTRQRHFHSPLPLASGVPQPGLDSALQALAKGTLGSPSEPPFPGPPLGPCPHSVLQDGGPCPAPPACGHPPPHLPSGICSDSDQPGSGLSEMLQILQLLNVPLAPGDGRGCAEAEEFLELLLWVGGWRARLGWTLCVGGVAMLSLNGARSRHGTRVPA